MEAGKEERLIKRVGYMFLLLCCIQAVAACGDSRGVKNGKIEEESFAENVTGDYDKMIPDEGIDAKRTEGVCGVSEQENAEHPGKTDSSGENESEEENLPEEEKKKVFPEEDTIFDNALPVNGMFSIFKEEEESGISRTTYNKVMAEKILTDILEVSAERAEDWTPESAVWPIYSITVWGGEGRPVQAAWCNGYWFSPNGVPYKFEYDFEALIAGYDWDEQRTLDMTDTRLVWEWFSRDGWYPYILWPAEEPAVLQEGISVKVISMEDNILTVEITNSGSESWIYGEMFDLDLLLDGIWYDMLPLSNAWGFDDYGIGLGAGESVKKAYDFTMYYGVIPEGKYRLCISDKKLVVEFAVE